MLGRKELQALSAACGEKLISLISDEIYHGLQYEGRAVSALEVTDEVYVINSFSKYFSMTGWRLGWMVVPPDHVRIVERLAQNMFICPAHASQVAALGALGPEGRAELDEHRAVYARNREILLSGLAEAGLTRTAPADGAFYVYVDVSELTEDSRALADRILDRAGVAVTPGLDFDKGRGGGTLRLSYARGTAEIEEGVARLVRFFRRG
jgi:aspartate/methionine/tyrosine aminotransferase